MTPTKFSFEPTGINGFLVLAELENGKIMELYTVATAAEAMRRIAAEERLEAERIATDCGSMAYMDKSLSA